MPENGYAALVDLVDDITKDYAVQGEGGEEGSTVDKASSLSILPDEEPERAEESLQQSCWADFRNPRRAAPKIYYFLYFAGLACIYPFLPVYFRMMGLSASQNGVLGALRPFVNFWSGPLFSAVADKLRRRRLVLCVCTTAMILFTFLLKFVPSSAGDGCGVTERCTKRHGTIGNGTTSSEFGYSTEPLSDPNAFFHFRWPSSASANISTAAVSTMSGDKDNSTLPPAWLSTDVPTVPSGSTHLTSAHGHDSTGSRSGSDNQKTFYLFVALIFIAELCGACVPGLSDTVVVESLGQDHSAAYGRQRLWGAVGWGVANAAVGYGATVLADSCGNGNYDLHFFLFVGVTAVSVAPQFCLTSERSEQTRLSQGAVNIKHGVRQALADVHTIAFFVAVFFLAMAMSIVDNFLFWFLSELCSSETLLGLSLLFMASSEIPLFTAAGWIISRFGHAAVLCFVFVCYAIRFFSYSLLSNPWWVLPIELLHGVTFALMWSCSVSYAKKIAPPCLEATMQGLLNGIYWGFGRGVGSLVGGFLYGRYGARWLFRVSAIGSVVCGCLYTLAECSKRHRDRRKTLESCSTMNNSCSDQELLQRTAAFENGELPSEGESSDRVKLIEAEEDAV